MNSSRAIILRLVQTPHKSKLQVPKINKSTGEKPKLRESERRFELLSRMDMAYSPMETGPIEPEKMYEIESLRELLHSQVRSSRFSTDTLPMVSNPRFLSDKLPNTRYKASNKIEHLNLSGTSEIDTIGWTREGKRYIQEKDGKMFKYLPNGFTSLLEPDEIKEFEAKIAEDARSRALVVWAPKSFALMKPSSENEPTIRRMKK